MSMKFIKGMVMGGLISTGAIIMYKEMSGKNGRQFVRKGKQMVRKMGLM